MPRMHVDQLEIDGALAQRLLAERFSEWADMPNPALYHEAENWLEIALSDSE
jgi:hypothetical protein